MNFKSIRKFFGIKTWMERYIERKEAEDIKRQESTDRIVAATIEAEAVSKYDEWKKDEEFIAAIDKTKPYWQLQIPVRFERMICGIYYIDHYETAKFKNVSWAKLRDERFEELKKLG